MFRSNGLIIFVPSDKVQYTIWVFIILYSFTLKDCKAVVFMPDTRRIKENMNKLKGKIILDTQNIYFSDII